MRRTIQPPPQDDWWVVETMELGTTACPSELFARQAAEVCSGSPYRLKVTAIRRANPVMFEGDRIAIAQSQQELKECMMDVLQKSGALHHKHYARKDVGRMISLARH